MIKKVLLILALPAVFAGTSMAQETVSGLQTNRAITRLDVKKERSNGTKSSTPLELPFFDDFSGQAVFPDSRKWSDSYVFINNTYSDRQITTGVATFDAIDNTGRMYETATWSGFAADTLTSQPINLDYTASDNIMLSFYYQPGGLGDFPEPNDSLALLFFAPEEDKWFSVWKAQASDSAFRQAALPVTDEKFLKNGFRFRFINYASVTGNAADISITGNCDHWNIDYVVLDKNRLESDTVYHDVAFRTGIRSLLKNYEAMPWNQFREIQLQEMGAFIPIQYRNSDVIIRNVTRNFDIFDVERNTTVHSFTAGAANIEPQTDMNYSAGLIYTFNSPATDSAVFRITCTLKTDDFDPKGNDTIVYHQVFKDYFAFDDGTAEMGYGVNGQGSRNAMVAYRFNSFTPDMLRAVMICFNDSYQRSNRRAFDLMVWDDSNGVPGNVIYSREEVMVETGDMINGFYTYTVDGEVPVNGTFYVGWKQRSETFLNAGLDVNTPNMGRQLYWLNGTWQQSQVNGSLMIRPVMGKSNAAAPVPAPGNSNQGGNATEQNRNTGISVYPNPATDFIKVTAENSSAAEPLLITVTDINGKELIRTQNSGEQIDISSLAPGIYFVFNVINGKRSGYGRLIKAR
ncbi:MAG: T9SS type A sorting domain-containing protein [Bacteroidales bacterium]|jgi:hypothetical protein|nr:T9SS type A sorting domain-containing protein [Bacteroidales bacterium]